MPRGGLKKKRGQKNNKQGRDYGGRKQRYKNGRPKTKTNSARRSPKQLSSQGLTANVGLSQQVGKGIPDNYQEIYSRYKAAIKRIFDYLQEFASKSHSEQGGQKQPMEKMTVHSLITTVDWMANKANDDNNNIQVDPDILVDLKFSIRVRTKVAISVFGAGDSGHKYFLDTLVYCWKVLDSLHPRMDKKSTARVEDDDELLEEWFKDQKDAAAGVLNDKELFSAQNVPRPTFNGEPMLLEDILFTDDRVDMGVFLFALDTLMGRVAQGYTHVAKTAARIKEKGEDFACILPSLLAAITSTNMAIQQVQRLEVELELHQPHITTPYRLLSVAAYSQDGYHRLIELTRMYGKKVCSTRDACLFTGDCLECIFCLQENPETHDTSSQLISDFCSRFQINSEGRFMLKAEFIFLRLSVVAELPLEIDRFCLQLPKDLPPCPPHSWFPKFQFIGGDRSIHHTLRLLELFDHFVKQGKEKHGHKCPKPMPGVFGPSPWQPGRSNKIHTDLDELLVHEILPCWFFISTDELHDFSEPPEQPELAPLWCCIRDYARSPGTPAKWSQVFAVHAILTGILETDKVVNEIASVSQKTFDSYFDQLNVACEHKKQVNGSYESIFFNDCMAAIQACSLLGQDLNFRPIAQWNPVCAGSILHYLNYKANLDWGSQLMIDDRSQLKIVLHLYNALVANEILGRDDIPFLDGLYSGFENSKKLWGGSLPRKGKFVEQFWLSMEGKLTISKEFMTKVSHLMDGTMLSDPEHLGMIKALCNSESQSFKGDLPAAEFSTTFRRIYKCDFQDVVNDDHGGEEPPSPLGRFYHQDLFAFDLRLHHTIQAFMTDCQLFGYNMAACGVYLDEFVCSMSRLLDWDVFKEGLQDQFTNWDHPERVADEYMFACSVLKALDDDDDAKDPSELDRIKDFVASFILPFFEKFSNKNRCIWISTKRKHGRVEENQHLGDQRSKCEVALVD